MTAFTEETKPERRGRRVTSAYRSTGVAGETTGSSADKQSGTRGTRDLLPPGTKVGRYELLRMIGEGGMGTVYEAMDLRLGRKVALKVLAEKLKSKRKAAKRFAIEAQAAARLDHPNVVAIFDFDVACEYPYMAMEYLQGETLAAALARGPLDIERLADIMLAVCAGVFAAHQAGIVHRDLKPSNIFLCRDWNGVDTARVFDFGISKVGGISSSELTQTGDIVGTSHYLSPEQASGTRQVSEASDQYALGVVMYECLTQRTPQRGQPIYSLLRNIAEGHHALVRELRKGVPPAFEAIVERAMQVRPKARYGSVAELAQALFPFASAEAQRQFVDFCGPVRCSQRSSDAGASDAGFSARESAVFLPPTDRLPSELPSRWQGETTRTSARPGSGRSRARSGASTASQPGKLRRIALSIALGAVLATLALLALALFVQF